MLTAVHSGLVITCKPDEFAIFDPPSGETCAAWASAFVSVAGGYLDNPDDTSDCRYCQFRVGDEFYEPLNISYANRWRDVWILFAYFVFNVIATISELLGIMGSFSLIDADVLVSCLPFPALR